MIQITTSFVDQKPAATSIELLYKKKVAWMVWGHGSGISVICS